MEGEEGSDEAAGRAGMLVAARVCKESSGAEARTDLSRQSSTRDSGHVRMISSEHIRIIIGTDEHMFDLSRAHEGESRGEGKKRASAEDACEPSSFVPLCL